MKLNRRSFLRQTGIGLTAALVAPRFLSCTDGNSITGSPFKNIGIQLYSLRDLIQQDPRAVIEQVAKIGYTHVETYGLHTDDMTFWGLKVDELKKLLDDNGLKTYSGHYDFSEYLTAGSTKTENIQAYMETAQKLGQEYIVAPVSPMHDIEALKASDYQYFAQKLDEAGQLTQEAGIKMVFHNHFWELKPLGNGTRGLDIMIAFTDPTLVDFELDLFWTVKAGESPQAYFEKYPNRFPLWHVKDMDRSASQPIDFEKERLPEQFDKIKYTEVGSGSIDFVNIARYQDTAGLKYAFVEQDEIAMDDKIASVRKSYEYVQRTLAK